MRTRSPLQSVKRLRIVVQNFLHRGGCKKIPEPPDPFFPFSRPSAPGAVPAVGRDVEDDAVWVAELVLGIGGSVAGRPGVVLAAMRLD